jgi:hypothetical protein
MEKLTSAIQNWPILLQGAIGSAIFWLVLSVGQRATNFFSLKADVLSKSKQKDHLLNEHLRASAKKEGDKYAAGAFYASVLCYRASRHVIRALIWLALGLIMNTITGIFGLIGFMGCLYYLFAALNVVKPFPEGNDPDERIKEVKKALAELQSEAK